MRVVAINPSDPRADRVQQACEVLRSGGLIAMPTETFYGVAADATNGEALSRLNPLKQKPEREPILLLLADRGQAEGVAADLPPAFDTLAETFWPGPLTLVVPAAGTVRPEVTGGRATVGIRIPGLALPRRLASALGRPITGVSANLHGQPAARSAAEVARSFPEGLDLILDGGPTPAGAPSTIIDLTGARPRLLRRGVIPTSSLEPFLEGPID